MIDRFLKTKEGQSSRSYKTKKEFLFKVPNLVDLKSILFTYVCCCLKKDLCCIKTKEYRTFMHQTKDIKGEIIQNLDLVKFIQRLRMHGVALKMIMDKDVKDVSGWFGYKRDIKYAGGKMAGINQENQEQYWDLTENISVKGKNLLE
jgi:hypothetical protein